MKSPIARPSQSRLWQGNRLLFASVGFAWAADYLHAFTAAEAAAWLGVGLCGYGALFCSIKGIAALVADYRLRKAFEVAQRPATDKHDSRWATEQEMADAGMYDGVGRILGTDLAGRLLFEPHRLKPTFGFISSPQGGGKTSTSVIASALLVPLSHKPGTEDKP